MVAVLPASYRSKSQFCSMFFYSDFEKPLLQKLHVEQNIFIHRKHVRKSDLGPNSTFSKH